MSETLIPTLSFRFVRRDGKLILQQMFTDMGSKSVWKDVPVHEESAEQAK